jgi:hypothetical protein
MSTPQLSGLSCWNNPEGGIHVREINDHPLGSSHVCLVGFLI